MFRVISSSQMSTRRSLNRQLLLLPLLRLTLILVQILTLVASSVSRQSSKTGDKPPSSSSSSPTATGGRDHASAIITGTYCQWETMNATCRQPDDVIVMTSARYGRMQPGRCVSRSYGSVGCSVDVLAHMDSICSGRSSCRLDVPDEKLRRMRPCPIDFAAYLEISYRCVTVTRPPTASGAGRASLQTCSEPVNESTRHPRRSIEIVLTGPGSSYASTPPYFDTDPSSSDGPSGGGYIASLVTDSAGTGTAGCSWLLKAAPWQRINITLIDFTAGLTAEAASTATGGGGGDDVGGGGGDDGPSSVVRLYDVDGKLPQSMSIPPSPDRGKEVRPLAYGGLEPLTGSGRPASNIGYEIGSDDDLESSETLYRRVDGDHPMTKIGRLPKHHHHRNHFAHRGFGNAGARLPYVDVDESSSSEVGVGDKDRKDFDDSSLLSSADSGTGNRFQVLHRTYCHKYAVVWEHLPVGGGNSPSHSSSELPSSAEYGQMTTAADQGQGLGHGRGTVVCGDTEREKVVYLSTSNEVELELARPVGLPSSSPDKQAPEGVAYFLLYYETIGCATLPPPANGWHERTGSDVMVVGCNATKERWYLHCDGRRWIGDWRNCTTAAEFRILVVSGCGVAIGLIIGTFLLSVLLLAIRRKRHPFVGVDHVFVSVPNGGDTRYNPTPNRELGTVTGPLNIGSPRTSLLYGTACSLYRQGAGGLIGVKSGFCTVGGKMPMYGHAPSDDSEMPLPMPPASAIYGTIPTSSISAAGDVLVVDDPMEMVGFTANGVIYDESRQASTGTGSLENAYGARTFYDVSAGNVEYGGGSITEAFNLSSSSASSLPSNCRFLQQHACRVLPPPPPAPVQPNQDARLTVGGVLGRPTGPVCRNCVNSGFGSSQRKILTMPGNSPQTSSCYLGGCVGQNGVTALATGTGPTDNPPNRDRMDCVPVATGDLNNTETQQQFLRILQRADQQLCVGVDGLESDCSGHGCDVLEWSSHPPAVNPDCSARSQ